MSGAAATPRRTGRPSTQATWAAIAVLLALAALAAFSLWGMKPTSGRAPSAAPATTAPAPSGGEREREGGEGGD